LHLEKEYPGEESFGSQFAATLREVRTHSHHDFADDESYTEGRQPVGRRRPRRQCSSEDLAMIAQLEADTEFEDSADPLQAFADGGFITDVLAEVKSGKEATVYCCRAHSSTGRELLAAKVYDRRAAAQYRTRRFYGQGRERIYKPDGRAMRAIRAKKKHGRELIFGDWIGQEFENLGLLHRAGADVPRPFACAGSGILMDFLGDEARPAPTLVGATLSLEEARRLFHQAMWNVRLFLVHDRVHGDLSPYNMLLWNGRLTIIDLPQMVHARWNDAAIDALKRDVGSVVDFFTQCGAEPPTGDLAGEIWTKYRRAELTVDGG
jgi:RIO kinase 1